MKKTILTLLTLIQLSATAQIINTSAGNGVATYAGDGGPAINASVNQPVGLIADNSGNYYIADGSNHCVRKVSFDGTISTFAGTGSQGNSGDGGPATSAELSLPSGLAFDLQNNLIVADYMAHVVRKIDIVTGIITTVAGTGVWGYAGDGGPATAAEFRYPTGVDFDSQGNMYITDQGNSRVRVVDAITGYITTFAGTGNPGYSGDGGPADLAEIRNPYDIKIDSDDNVIFSEVFTHIVRKVNVSTGIISTVAESWINVKSVSMVFFIVNRIT